MARMDGQGTVPACSAGNELRDRGSSPAADPAFRQSVLLCDMPSGSNAGHHFMDPRKDKEEEPLPFQLLPCQELAAIYRARAVHRWTGPRSPFDRDPHSSIQRLRTHRRQPLRSSLPVGQQFLRMDCRESRKLRILQR